MDKNNYLRRKRDRIVLASIIIVICAVIIMGIHTYIQGVQAPEVNVAPKNCYDRTINVVADYDYDPYSFIDANGKKSGHDVELIYTIANEMKVNVNLKLMSWEDAQKAIEKGDADIIMGLEYANEEAKAYNLTIPFNTDQFICFGRNEFTYINELEGKTIATLDENKNYDYLFSYAKNIDCSSYSEAFEKLRNGQVDYVICRYAVGRRIVARLDDSSIKAMGPTLINNQLCLGVRKGEEKLCDEVNAVIDKLMNEGYNQQLSDEWLGQYVQVIGITDFIKKYSIYFILGIIFIILIVIWVLFAINRKMRIAKNISDVNRQCIDLMATQTRNAIFEWDITAGNMALEVNFDRFNGLLNNKESKNNAFPEDIEIIENIKDRILNGEKVERKRFRILDENGQPHWYEVTTTVIDEKDGPFPNKRSVGLIVDADEIISKEMTLRNKAEKDLLTGIYNKLTSEALIRDALADRDLQGALFVIDVDDLKKVNDDMGHMYGDIVIKKLATDLQRTFGEDAILGRIGGDEFIAFIECDEIETAEELAKTMCENYMSCIHEKARNLDTTCSVGAAFRRNSESFEELFSIGDKALYDVKKNSKNSYKIY